jgi:hypothetical protein
MVTDGHKKRDNPKITPPKQLKHNINKLFYSPNIFDFISPIATPSANI